MSATDNDIVVGIRDLTRVIIATSGKFESRADVRQFAGMGISSNRVGAILEIPAKDVRSTLAKVKKKRSKNG